jgi:Heterokaryon incompatibility protein (HET)
VWGTDQPASRTEHSMTLPSDLPLLITDAMCATKSLGLKYLWIDRYCITETDKTLKHEQIRKMDLIYGQAEITIISLGKDPSCGLPGISTVPRSPQISFQVGHHTILGSMPNPRFAIENSKWWTRAWTLQEAVLSTRRLYFTQDQVYFECRQGHRCEVIKYKSNFIQRENDGGPWGLGGVPPDPGTTIENLQNIIRTYFQRDMTYPTDTIPAISGIFRRHLTAVTSTKCYFGLPFKIFQDPLSSGKIEEASSRRCVVTEAFLAALMWGVRTPTRRQEYPSWSWAGWYGKTLWFSSQALDPVATIWVERPGAGVERIRDFYETGGFDLAPSKHSRFIWLEAPAVRLKFINRSTRPDVTEIRVVLFWGSGEKGERSFHEIGRLPLPSDKELEQYSDFMLFRLGEVRDRPGISAVMLVADRDGQKERIWSSTYGKDVDADYGDSKKEWEPYNREKPILPKGINLCSWDKIVWEIVKVRIG